MTIWEHIVENSTLDEADGDFWEHLTNPSGKGSGVILNSEIDYLLDSENITYFIEDDYDIIMEVENVDLLTESDVNDLVAEEENINIEDLVEGIC